MASDDEQNNPLPIPGDPPTLEGGPKTWGEFLAYWAVQLTRETAPYRLVRAIQYVFDPDAYIHDELQLTSHPQTTGFDVRLQAHPLDAAGTEQRAMVNFEGERSIIRLEEITRDARSAVAARPRCSPHHRPVPAACVLRTRYHRNHAQAAPTFQRAACSSRRPCLAGFQP